MNENIDLKETSRYLLTLDPDYDYSNEELDRDIDIADALIKKYGWPTVYKEWSRFLHEECPTDKDVIWFAHNYSSYALDTVLPDPLQFIAYLYYRVDTGKNQDAARIFDSLAITVLPTAGLVDLIEDPYYAAENDPRIQAEIANWERIESKVQRS